MCNKEGWAFLCRPTIHQSKGLIHTSTWLAQGSKLHLKSGNVVGLTFSHCCIFTMKQTCSWHALNVIMPNILTQLPKHKQCISSHKARSCEQSNSVESCKTTKSARKTPSSSPQNEQYNHTTRTATRNSRYLSSSTSSCSLPSTTNICAWASASATKTVTLKRLYVSTPTCFAQR